jgi:outer membrane murein-binding lipoprotein Lpp
MRSATGGAGSLSGSGLRLPGSLGVVALLLVAGCGGGESDVMRKRVSSLQDEVNLLQNTVDRLEERLAAVESRPVGPAASADGSRASESRTSERPRLRVIRVEPGEADAPGDAASQPEGQPGPEEPEAPRPVIRGSGNRVETELPPGPTSCLERARQPARATASLMGQTPGQRGRLRARGA